MASAKYGSLSTPSSTIQTQQTSQVPIKDYNDDNTDCGRSCSTTSGLQTQLTISPSIWLWHYQQKYKFEDFSSKPPPQTFVIDNMIPVHRMAPSATSSPQKQIRFQFSPSLTEADSQRHDVESNIKEYCFLKQDADTITHTVTVEDYKCSYPFKHACLQQTRRQVKTCDLCGVFLDQEQTWFCCKCNCDICNSCYVRRKHFV